MSRKLVWMTHSFREDSRLMSLLTGECVFVYYSPFYFAGAREAEIYKRCSKANIQAFHATINRFDRMLRARIGSPLYLFKTANVADHINSLISQYGIQEVIIDQPLFGMWHTVNLDCINARVDMIDSDMINRKCLKMTAKARWTDHIRSLDHFLPNQMSTRIQGFRLTGYLGFSYPDAPLNPLLDVRRIFTYAAEQAPFYKQCRDRHDGQTRLSVALHHGVLDPANVFYALAKMFRDRDDDAFDQEGRAAAILRQFAFREISIMKARLGELTLEDEPLTWARKLMHKDSYDHLVGWKNPEGRLNFDDIAESETGDVDLDFLLEELQQTGIMPNRGRMWYASKVFYESPTGVDALNSLINTFDLLGLDGQSPNNYTQVCGALSLTYGKVLKMNRDRAFELLAYNK